MKFEIAPKSTEIQANWDNARLYSFFLTIDGKSGWRLPTKNEFSEIWKSDNDFDGWYWSSTEIDTTRAWVKNFLSNGFHKANKLDDRIRTRLVRDLL